MVDGALLILFPQFGSYPDLLHQVHKFQILHVMTWIVKISLENAKLCEARKLCADHFDKFWIREFSNPFDRTCVVDI